MFVLIDKDQMKMVAAAHRRSHIYLVLEVDFPGMNAEVCNAHDGGSWTTFSQEQMDALYKNTSGLPEAPEYGEAIEQLRAYVLQWTDYHHTEEELAAQAEAMRQTAIENGDIPEDDPIQQQIAANQAMRKAHQETIAMVERANEQHEKQPEVIEAKAKEKAAPKPVAAPTQGVTKRVWEIADAVKNVNPQVDMKLIRKKVMEICHEEGVNPGTAATQYGRWKQDRGYA